MNTLNIINLASRFFYDQAHQKLEKSIAFIGRASKRGLGKNMEWEFHR